MLSSCFIELKRKLQWQNKKLYSLSTLDFKAIKYFLAATADVSTSVVSSNFFFVA